ncbi:hypothetical protein MSHOH_1688 [Methanosarcina horonobensis HB-1 = JCM 15518]|uniref:DUF3566 domain-containing protein n=1 Tax=Methanosarcina horonobensis HB-1 = JCM 15518 TaxID=1434110 RepID=A0A0E3SBG1_9EURY|nr:hypothetical protein [Methanosarcina horonobensis]AKB78171.1 hypothetical protein MSHOH_1688 [Methanosarcina horonobensis HB-1 = JCM 15518]
MVQIKSLNSTSLAKVLGLMYLILAVIFSPFILLMASAGGQIGLTESVIMILAIILFYGIAGGIGGFLIGAIYNFIAKRFGGIEMELETA